VRVVIAEAGESVEHPLVTTALEPAEGGWWQADVLEAQPGREYGFLLDDDEQVLPDPRSRRQPHGVHQPSRFYADDFTWTDGQWPGHDLPDSVFYELHVGTFTPAGTLEAAIERLDHLVALGVTHVELLPVNDFNGEWNWGYDGVLWYAVHEAYGGPDGLKRLVNACHRAGLAVVLDVVYNHLGASGNYLTRFGPYLQTDRNTWGDLVNLDGESAGPVREYILDNALMWLTEFHVDGLRLDAVHALHDSSDVHLLAELSARVRALSTKLGRPLLLIAESDLNDPVMFTARDQGGYGLDGQWDDDVHHALHALLTGERQGYYGDFGSLPVLAKVLTQAGGHRAHPGVPVRRLPPEPRPGRQPGSRRPAPPDHLTRPAEGRRHAAADLTVHPVALHGRGVGRQHAVALLHLTPRAGDGRGHPPGADRGVRRSRLGAGRRRQPSGSGRLHRSEAEVG
jgi:maltooligosyltrehalose trehalohydrolase